LNPLDGPTADLGHQLRIGLGERLLG